MLAVGMSLLVKAQETKHGCLEIFAIGVEEISRLGTALDVFCLDRGADGIERSRADHAVVGDAGGLVDIELVVGGTERRAVARQQVAIRLALGEIAGRVGVVGVQLMIDANQVVPAV